MKTTQLLLVCLWMSMDIPAQSQTHTSKLIVEKGEVLELSSESLYFDTLIMQDNSRIVFLAPETKLVIENAFIGKNCLWDASGKSAKKKIKPTSEKWSADPYGYSAKYFSRSQGSAGPGRKGADGNPGRDISATVLFQFLGELTIDVKGGYGHMGGHGYSGAAGANGSNFPVGGSGGAGGMGGNGGDGGTISLSYACDGFSPVFNKGGFRSIHLECHGGKGGIGGRPGKGGAGGMPTVRYDYSNARTANAIAEWEGQKGRAGRFGRNGPAGEDGQSGGITLNKLN